MRTAKETFRDSTAFKDYQTILASPAFEPACIAALADYIESLPKETSEPSKSWDCYLKILGARAVLEKLSQLHESDSAAPPTKSAVLKYQTNQPNYRP